MSGVLPHMERNHWQWTTSPRRIKNIPVYYWCGVLRLTSPLLFLLLMTTTAPAVDIYSLFDSGCKRHTGILAHVDETRVVLVDLEGKPIWVSRASIQHLVLHQVLENPLQQITTSSHLHPLLRQVWIEKTDRPTFSGWVSGFHDDLLIFFDSEGKTHVLQASEIVRIRPWSQDRLLQLTHYRVPQLGFPPTIVPCSTEPLRFPPHPPINRPSSMPTTLPTHPGLPSSMLVDTSTSAEDSAVMPSRVIADRIKIDDMLTALAEHYRDLAALEERTHVYARPYHFEPTLRLGLTYAEQAGYSEYFPFYIIYTGGKPYRFQSRIVLGQMVHDALPFMRPTLSASSDIKSHFFHVTFVGHLPALPAESNPFLTDTGELQPDSEDSWPNSGNPMVPSTGDPQQSVEELQEVTVTTSYNYLILMGVDYWRLSASFGPAFFSMAVQATISGEVGLNGYLLATSASPVFRLQYLADRWQVRLLYYRTRMSGPITTGIGGSSDELNDGQINCDTRNDAFRLGVTAQLPLKIIASLDEVFALGSIEGSAEGIKIPLSFMRSETTLMVGAQFGRYIAVKAYTRLLARRFHLQLAEQSPQNHFEALFGGALEFVFY